MKPELLALETFDDLCKLHGTTEQEFIETCKARGDEPDEIAYKKIKLITKTFNTAKINILDTTQKKWFPWFWVSSSGLAFANSTYNYVNASAAVGSCLCFDSEEASDFAGKKFLKEWEDFIVGEK